MPSPSTLTSAAVIGLASHGAAASGVDLGIDRVGQEGAVVTVVEPRHDRLGRRLRPAPFRLSTTPGRLRLAGVAILLGAVGFGLLGATAAASRRDAAVTAAHQTEPLLVRAVRLHDALADADATASATFVIGGAEPLARRGRYLADIADASTALAQIGRVTSSASERAAVSSIARELPVYTGLVDTARADNRQGFPVGAAYLRQASEVMRSEILPAAARIYAVEGRDLQNRYRSGASRAAVVTFAGTGLLMLAVLIATQVFLARLTRRRLNLPLLAATVGVLAATAWGLLGLSAEQHALSRAQHDGSDPVEVLSAVRALALRAQADEGLSLAARGSGADSLLDFDDSMRRIGSGGGPRPLSDAGIQGLGEQFAAYRRVHSRVVGFEQAGEFTAAADLSVGQKGQELLLADRIRRSLDRLITTGQERFQAAAGDAVDAVDALWLAIPAIALASALAGLYGLRLRMREYR